MGVDAIVVPWDGVALSSGKASFTDASLKLLFELCPQFGIAIVPLVPFSELRNATTVQLDLDYFRRLYAHERAQLRVDGKPVLVVYDAHVLKGAAELVARNPDLGLLATGLSFGDFLSVFEDGFLGFLTYFASDGASWGSDHKNWESFSAIASDRGMLFVPAVSPGYNDSAANPWNSHALRGRECDAYYATRWGAAIESRADIVMVNSWNSWTEGSAIEPVVGTAARPLTDAVWCGTDAHHFVEKTAEWIGRFKEAPAA